MRKSLVVIVVLLIANTIAYGQDVNAYIELLRSDVKTQRIAIIKEAMQFTGAESSAFWPVYKKYEYELDEINDERVELIKDYALNYNNLTDEKSEELIKKSLVRLRNAEFINKISANSGPKVSYRLI